MCDKGILEISPEVAKLEYCIIIPREIQEELVEGINKLLGIEDAYIESPIPGNFPEKNPGGRNTIRITKGRNARWGSVICSFSLGEFPGCCGTLISYHQQVGFDFRQKGISNFLQKIKEKIARYNSFSSLICTTVEGNSVERHILEKHGWRETGRFKNINSGNTVLYYTKDLNE